MATKLIPARELLEMYDKRPVWQKRIDDVITYSQIRLFKIRIKIKNVLGRIAYRR